MNKTFRHTQVGSRRLALNLWHLDALLVDMEVGVVPGELSGGHPSVPACAGVTSAESRS